MKPEGSLPCSQEFSTVFYSEPDQPSPYIPPHPFSLRYILILSSHLPLGLPSGLFPSGLPPKPYMHSSSPHACHMPCPSHCPWLDHSNYIWRRVQVMKLLIMQFSLSPTISSLFSPNILLSTLFSNTLNVRDQVLHPYTTTGQIIVLYIPNFTFLDSRREDKRFWSEW
jgi:hypothetical protein